MPAIIDAQFVILYARLLFFIMDEVLVGKALLLVLCSIQSNIHGPIIVRR